MASCNLGDIIPESTVGLRSKGSFIFYTCTVLSVAGDKFILSLPTFRDPAVNTMRKVELRVLNGTGEYEPALYEGTVNEMFADFLEVTITSKLKYTERRKSIRVPCEKKIRYMELKSADETWYTTFSINISPGGIKMYSSRFHQEGDILIFQFNIPDGYSSRNIMVRGRVLKIKKLADINYNNQVGQGYRKYIVNVCFEGLSAADCFGFTRYIYTNSRG